MGKEGAGARCRVRRSQTSGSGRRGEASGKGSVRVSRLAWGAAASAPFPLLPPEQGSQGEFSGPAAAAAPRNVLAMQVSRPHRRPTESELGGAASSQHSSMRTLPQTRLLQFHM